MTMSRPELDGWLAAVDRLNGGSSGRKDTSQTTRQSFKSLRKKRRKVSRKMVGNFKVGMTLTAKDEASQVLEKGQKQVIKATEGVTKATGKQAQSRSVPSRKALTARKRPQKRYSVPPVQETLGIRAEREIRREIYLTVASYNRLAAPVLNLRRSRNAPCRPRGKKPGTQA